jgi:tetratricopeptide (TPR) repeat protein
LYTLAQIDTQSDSVLQPTVDSLYDEIILHYPSSEFANEARKIRGLPEQRQAKDPAEALYVMGEDLIKRDSAESAIGVFQEIVRAHRLSPFAPKAQYAIGWIYEELILEPDSAVAHYRQLLREFPSTPYATTASAKLGDAQSLPPVKEREVRKDPRSRGAGANDMDPARDAPLLRKNDPSQIHDQDLEDAESDTTKEDDSPRGPKPR